MERRRGSRVKGALINLRSELDNFLDVSNLYHSTILSAVDIRLGIFLSSLNEACCENVMPLRGDIDHNVDNAMTAVHGQILRIRSIVNAVRARTQLPSNTEPLESDFGGADPQGSPGSEL